MRLSIKAKIVGGFIAIFAIGMAIGIYGLFSISVISKISEEQAEFQDASLAISDVLEAHYGWRQNLTVSIFSGAKFNGSYNPDTCALGVWRNSKEATKTADNEMLAMLEQLDVPHRYIHGEAETLMNMIAAGQNEQAQKEFIDNVLPAANNAIEILNKMTERYDTLLDGKTESAQEIQNRTMWVIAGLILFAVILCFVLAVIILKSVLNPLRVLSNSANMVAEGNFNVNFKYDVNDEIGVLTTSFIKLVSTFRLLINDMNEMAAKHSAGEIKHFITTDKYTGEFKDVVSGVNSMIEEHLTNISSVLDIVEKYADGNFDAKLNKLPGDKAVANTVLDMVSNNLRNVEKSVMTLVKSAMDGDLDNRIDDSKFNGGWKDIISGMNGLLEAVNAPLAEAQYVLSHVAEGNLSTKIAGKYKGQFEKMSSSINKTVEVLSVYISEISNTLNKLASDNFNVSISNEYVGNFSDIKTSLNAIIDRLNKVMNEIGTAAEQVAVGSGQISETSVTLSQGATEQASAVEELNATIEEVRSKILESSESSTYANRLVLNTKGDAEQGNKKMADMLTAMTEINTASQNISKIIKVIEDIAFQTNLLALNAAVEAARAGDHGKGFAVVAEEVRSLAARSQSSAKETADLIEHSMNKVNEGTTIANSTADALSKIVTGVENVSEIINKIEVSAKDQATAITQINEGVSQISEVTQGNSATSEESAAAADELSNQAEMLKSMIRRFELRKK